MSPLARAIRRRTLFLFSTMLLLGMLRSPLLNNASADVYDEFNTFARGAFGAEKDPLIYERFGAFGLKHARPVSVLFIGVCLVFFIVMRLLARHERHAAH